MPSLSTAATVHDRLLAALAHVVPPSHGLQDAVRSLPLTDPNRMRELLTRLLSGTAEQVVVTGTVERRLLALLPAGSRTWLLADLSGRPHRDRPWPQWARQGIDLHSPGDWLSTASLSADARRRLTHPRILLAALYHPEHFPLPRFPLGISDLARAVRSTLSGQVDLLDMQLGATLDTITADAGNGGYDIVGLSATFGQHDLLTRVLDHVSALPSPPRLIAGGSLTARNERLLLERYPSLLIARGAGEPTIADLIALHHGDIDLDQVRGIGYAGAPRGGGMAVGRFRVRRTPTVANRVQADAMPELDLLPTTFAHHGVAQLETSRGCTNYCSFCPRGHKGTWSGSEPTVLPPILDAISEVFDQHPEVARVLYLVDEEFIGRGPDAVPRALAVSAALHERGFQWETSCRIDQVSRPDRNRDWHVERARLWRALLSHGLRRCLFGIESGVTSVLERFNKETTAEQNTLGIRTLSALGVPTRFTYITFDHLMNEAELRATHAFQGRRDLLLRPLPHLSAEEIVDGVRDEAFVAEHSTGQPFYTSVSYMLVSMECLIGAAYTKQVQAAGLAGPPRPSMGRVDAEFADWRIGVCSQAAQLWVDRNFALDYTLKSVEKVLGGPERHRVRQTREVLKRSAFDLLTTMVRQVGAYQVHHKESTALAEALFSSMDAEIKRLRTRLDRALPELARALPSKHADLLHREYRRWTATREWRLINAADPCGT